MEGTSNCSACYSQIKRTANYCENCGHKKSDGYDTEFSNGKINRGQKLIFAALIILCGTTFYHFLIGIFVKISGDWRFYETIEPFTLAISFAAGCAALLIALGLDSGARKTLAIIFASVYALIHCYWIIDRLFPDKQPFEFLSF